MAVLVDKLKCDEIWKEIPFTDGRYSASNMGRLRRNETGRVLNPSISGKGYLRTAFGKGSKTYFAHRVIAMVFIPNPYNLPSVNHKNGIKTDNRVENLEWCTHAENNRHALDTGLRDPYGESSHYATTSEKQAIDIYKNNEGLTVPKLAEKHGVSIDVVRQIHSGKTWAHVTSGLTHNPPPNACEKMVLDTLTGVYYDTIKDAAFAVNVTAKHMSNMLSGFRKNKTPLIVV